MCQALCWPQGSPLQVNWTWLLLTMQRQVWSHSICAPSVPTLRADAPIRCANDSVSRAACAALFSPKYHGGFPEVVPCVLTACKGKKKPKFQRCTPLHSETPDLGQRHTHQAALHSSRPDRGCAGARMLRVWWPGKHPVRSCKS